MCVGWWCGGAAVWCGVVVVMVVLPCSLKGSGDLIVCLLHRAILLLLVLIVSV